MYVSEPTTESSDCVSPLGIQYGRVLHLVWQQLFSLLCREFVSKHYEQCGCQCIRITILYVVFF